ncbi:hypothetical protein Lal_00004648 [Lupinus albus]|nr:hypothetical protein Lal_00004648 [Lupinus albus]
MILQICLKRILLGFGCWRGLLTLVTSVTLLMDCFLHGAIHYVKVPATRACVYWGVQLMDNATCGYQLQRRAGAGDKGLQVLARVCKLRLSGRVGAVRRGVRAPSTGGAGRRGVRVSTVGACGFGGRACGCRPHGHAGDSRMGMRVPTAGRAGANIRGVRVPAAGACGCRRQGRAGAGGRGVRVSRACGYQRPANDDQGVRVPAIGACM